MQTKSECFLPYYGCLFFCILLFSACKKELSPISVQEFETFVEATDYVTDAERFAWSIVQINVFDFLVVEHIDWRCPDGKEEAKADFPVTQVSYNDALAYANWAGVQLPSYAEYWELVNKGAHPINSNSSQILPLNQVHIIGNVWDITTPDPLGRIRLAGGSYLCNENSCNGTSEARVLHVDAATGNTHIGFSVLR